jgi:hypothetical protein
MRNGRPTTNDELLSQIEGLDPIVTDLRRYRRYARMLADPLFERALIDQTAGYIRNTATSALEPAEQAARRLTSLG